MLREMNLFFVQYNFFFKILKNLCMIQILDFLFSQDQGAVTAQLSFPYCFCSLITMCVCRRTCRLSSSQAIYRPRATKAPSNRSPPLLPRNTKDKTGVINDPLARPIVMPVANIVYCCFVFLDLKSGDGQTTCAKTMIPTGRNLGLPEWINNFCFKSIKT